MGISQSEAEERFQDAVENAEAKGFTVRIGINEGATADLEYESDFNTIVIEDTGDWKKNLAELRRALDERYYVLRQHYHYLERK